MPEGDELDRKWDAVVIGTGVGGATLGYALAGRGMRVLFCDKGRSSLSGAGALRGAYPEESFPRPAAPPGAQRDTLAAAGRCTDEWFEHGATRSTRFVPFVGNGTGGSSALYGMALERFFPADFAPGSATRIPAESSRPATWPIGYDEIAPYYAAAEALYRVRGVGDPLRNGERMGYVAEPPTASATARELTGHFITNGFHPYRLPVACEVVPGCTACQGYLCARDCKNDSARVCLAPAVARHGAVVLDECEVLALDADASRVNAAICRRHGRTLRLRSDLFVLAAGALETPRILLRSACGDWPRGLANGSGLVGRNLMRHLVDLWLVFTGAASEAGDYTKEIAFNDLYERNEPRLGSVQSFGRLPPARVLVSDLVQDARDGAFPPLAPLLAALRPLLEPALRRMFARGVLLATIVEDLPYPDNGVLFDAAAPFGAPRLEYRMRAFERRKVALMRDRMKALLKPYRHRLLKQAENNHRLAHACGTCRFGADPRTSVLDPNNRAHGLANLLVVDGSFFPSSGGTNPALTIAANALRVAERLAGPA